MSCICSSTSHRGNFLVVVVAAGAAVADPHVINPTAVALAPASDRNGVSTCGMLEPTADSNGGARPAANVGYASPTVAAVAATAAVVVAAPESAGDASVGPVEGGGPVGSLDVIDESLAS